MTDAEKRGLESYPPILEYPSMMMVAMGEKVDSNAKNREIFIQGYEEAKKDFVAKLRDFCKYEGMLYFPSEEQSGSFITYFEEFLKQDI